MVLVDESRSFVDANTAALLALRLTLAELRGLSVQDLTPRDMLPTMEAAWSRLVEAGCVAGPYELAMPASARLEITYYALADVLPGVHLAAFAPAGWPERELIRSLELPGLVETSTLTPRELEVLELAAEGHGARRIAAELVVSPSTVRTHFEHIYAKLGVRDRAAAVAKAMRLGFIS
jgi:DNA-binding CsgD family transcriptional regulator